MLSAGESSLGSMQDPPPHGKFNDGVTLNDEDGNGNTLGSGLSWEGSGTEDNVNPTGLRTTQNGNKRLLAMALFLVIGIVVAAVLLVQGAQENRKPSKAALAPVVPSPTLSPTSKPTLNPTNAPTVAPVTSNPTVSPTSLPTARPTSSPSLMNSTAQPSANDTSFGEQNVTLAPSGAPNGSTSSSPNAGNSTNTTGLTYVPGDLSLTEVGLDLSRGLRARIIATTGQRVTYHNGSKSARSFHGNPDFGATFLDTRGNNPGGWVYVSNSEMNTTGAGGVGAITFDKDGNIIDYRMVLENTTMNCAGGRTPW